MKVEFINCSECNLEFNIEVNNGRSFSFRLDPEDNITKYNISPIGGVKAPQYVLDQALRTFTRFLNWFLILDSFKASISGSSLKSIYIQDPIFKHWRFKMYDLNMGCKLHQFTNYYLFYK